MKLLVRVWKGVRMLKCCATPERGGTWKSLLRGSKQLWEFMSIESLKIHPEGIAIRTEDPLHMQKSLQELSISTRLFSLVLFDFSNNKHSEHGNYDSSQSLIKQRALNLLNQHCLSYSQKLRGVFLGLRSEDKDLVSPFLQSQVLRAASETHGTQELFNSRSTEAFYIVLHILIVENSKE